MSAETEIELMRQIIKASNVANKYAEKVLDLTLENKRLEKENFELRNETDVLNNAGEEPIAETHEHKYSFENAHVTVNGYRMFFCTVEGCKHSEILCERDQIQIIENYLNNL